MKKRSNKMYSISTKLCFFCCVLYAFGYILLTAETYSCSIQVQVINNEIKSMEASIDALEMKKQELVAFDRISEVAIRNGYTYRSDAVAVYSSNTNGVVE